MKKIISLTLVSSVAIMLITGCGSSSAKPSKLDPSLNENALYVHMHNNEKLARAIKTAGEASGWKITEFKSNSVIAEKILGDTTYASTLKFYDGHIEFENAEGTDNSDLDSLKDAIEKATQQTPSH